jgi:UDP-N-acetylmuramate--alanine ligase
VLCTDDEVVREILPQVGRPTLRYGLGDDADVRAAALAREAGATRFDALRPNRAPLTVRLNLPGLHNVRNALAAIAVATELEVEDAAIQRALAGFQGIARRLEVVGEVATRAGRVTLVDDYGHHPTEIEATIEAARQAWPDRRLVLAFQPHRYTRTRDLIDDFGRALSAADALLVTEVYAAGEEPIANADGRAICRAVRGRGRIEPVFVEDLQELPAALAAVIADRDVVLTMGAGSIGALAHELPGRLGVASARAGR